MHSYLFWKSLCVNSKCESVWVCIYSLCNPCSCFITFLIFFYCVLHNVGNNCRNPGLFCLPLKNINFVKLLSDHLDSVEADFNLCYSRGIFLFNFLFVLVTALLLVFSPYSGNSIESLRCWARPLCSGKARASVFSQHSATSEISLEPLDPQMLFSARLSNVFLCACTVYV